VMTRQNNPIGADVQSLSVYRSSWLVTAQSGTLCRKSSMEAARSSFEVFYSGVRLSIRRLVEFIVKQSC
jgi:hypothetical protein